MRIARDAALNLAGHVLPLASAFFAVPPLLAVLGQERFGFLALAWALVGYFSFLDLGMGRALSRLVAAGNSAAEGERLYAVSRGTLGLTAAFGVAAGVLVFGAAEWICTRALLVPQALLGEAIDGVRILAASLPVLTLTAGFRGLLEGVRKFGSVNAVRIPLGILTFAAPLALSAYSVHLAALCGVLALLRCAALAAYWAVCLRMLPALARPALPRREAFGALWRDSAWMTVSNVGGSLMIYLDRFVIGGMLGVAAVGYYTAPYEVLTRLAVFPAALTAALFPAFAAAAAAQARVLYRKGLAVTAAMVLPLAVLAAAFSPQWLSLWLGAEFAAQASPVARWLALGVGVNCLAHVPFALLQGRGRADLTGKVHLAELPFYVALLPILIAWLGIEGAAIAWSLRCAVDAAALFALCAGHWRSVR